MYGRLRRKTRPEAQVEPKFVQDNFQGGLNEDFPASGIGANELTVLENLIAFPDGLEGRSGTKLFSNVTLPGSGTVHYLAFHPQTKKFLLHRGTDLYLSGDSNMLSWTQVKLHGMSYRSLTGGAGITGTGVTSALIRGMSATNTDSGTCYWRLSNSGTTRTLNVYSDASKANLIGTGSRTSDGGLGITMSNASGFGAYCVIAYGGATTEGTFYLSAGYPYEVGLATNDDSKILAYKDDFIVAVDSASSTSTYGTENVWAFAYVNTSKTLMAFLGGGSTRGYGQTPIYDSGTEGVATPYGRRYLYTYSRIVNSTGNPDSTVDRVSGTLVFEGPSNGQTRISGDESTRDYAEYWSANAVSVSNPNTVSLIDTGNIATGNPLTSSAMGHYTHVSLYGSLDVGDNGIDPETGAGNNRELFTWIADVDISSTSMSDEKTDDELRARYVNGFGLRTRFFTEIPYSEIVDVVGSFIFALKRGQTEIYYGQLSKPEYMGFYRSDQQFITLDDGVQEIKKLGNNLMVLCARSTYLVNPALYSDQGLVESVFVLRGPQRISDNIGVLDYGSIAYMDENSFIAHCSDRTIRVFSGLAWGPDLAANKVSKTIEQIAVPGSVGGFISGVYLLWFRTIGSTNEKCLRYGFGGRSGHGWSVVTGADFPFPPLLTGAVVINDINSIQRLIVLDNSDGVFHWVETFQNQGLSKVYKDKVDVFGAGGTNIFPRFRPRELSGPTEDHTCYHEESHVYLRPLGDSFLRGFNLTALAYTGGDLTAVGSIKASTTGGDIQFYDRVRGVRIQQEYAFINSGFKVVKTDTHYQVHDTARIDDGPENSDEAGYQSEISSNMKHWLTREKKKKNRANALDYTMTWADFSFVSSPDGKTYGVPMGAFGESSDTRLFTQSDTTVYSDFTVMFWIDQISAYPTKKIFEIQGTNNFYVQFTNSTTIDINGAGNVTLSTLSTWSHIAIVRSGSTVSVYQDKVLKGTVSVSGTKGGSRFYWNGQRDPGFYLYDGRVYNTVITTSALAFYYTDVITGNGLKTLPIV